MTTRDRRTVAMGAAFLLLALGGGFVLRTVLGDDALAPEQKAAVAWARAQVDHDSDAVADHSCAGNKQSLGTLLSSVRDGEQIASYGSQPTDDDHYAVTIGTSPSRVVTVTVVEHGDEFQVCG
ncbi:hypothetical protein G5V59_15545 [Nocardioides sp. W3-2-3]|uniref:hypothetical protein n=1 Tax=Nocardioides convexus TaxID=2712224 RepID=UPI0024185607|nr:hypothetical protein [Nocardioides convexus]NHA00855.1 hypothetical protein [Nocardioides convexus]